MTYNLFIDDIRNPLYVYPNSDEAWVIARSSADAIRIVEKRGIPKFIAFDHDLGGIDTSMVFLNWLAREYWDGESPIPEYEIHSDNPVGMQNIRSFMKSWKKYHEEK